ncbi:hypothetical protein EBI_26271 [Enterocytozoon bieneusi H348]|nr:hypothetical protein EBI_26271 [Enterocytozoon bieneusi H348]|eukprot:XP_002650567.1 hypothetical protein EBI_26271 [Enterocytozoon bieneusi H348]
MVLIAEIYEKTIKELEEGIKKYMNDKLDLEELLELNYKKNLFKNDLKSTIEKEEKRLKQFIFTCIKSLYDKINKIEEKKNILCTIDDAYIDVDKYELFLYGIFVGQNKLPPQGAETSQYYLPPYSILNNKNLN